MPTRSQQFQRANSERSYKKCRGLRHLSRRAAMTYRDRDHHANSVLRSAFVSTPQAHDLHHLARPSWRDAVRIRCSRPLGFFSNSSPSALCAELSEAVPVAESWKKLEYLRKHRWMDSQTFTVRGWTTRLGDAFSAQLNMDQWSMGTPREIIKFSPAEMLMDPCREVFSNGLCSGLAPPRWRSACSS